jgi:hypothetical protein
MQQFCTYGSVRGASGKPASLPRQNAQSRGFPVPSKPPLIALGRDFRFYFPVSAYLTARLGQSRHTTPQPTSGESTDARFRTRTKL